MVSRWGIKISPNWSESLWRWLVSRWGVRTGQNRCEYGWCQDGVSKHVRTDPNRSGDGWCQDGVSRLVRIVVEIVGVKMGVSKLVRIGPKRCGGRWCQDGCVKIGPHWSEPLWRWLVSRCGYQNQPELVRLVVAMVGVKMGCPNWSESLW